MMSHEMEHGETRLKTFSDDNNIQSEEATLNLASSFCP